MACTTTTTTSFIRALIDADASVLDTLLNIEKRNFNIDDMIDDEVPAMHFAVMFRLVDSVKVLLKHGANVELEDKDGATCLNLAMWTQLSSANVKRVRKLLKDVVLDSACKEKLTSPFSTENQQSVQNFFESNGSVEEKKIVPHVNYDDFLDHSLIELLLSFGANPNRQEHRHLTPFLRYCANEDCKDIRVFNLLLQYGADVSLKADGDFTALGFSAEYGTVEMVQKLLDAGANVNDIMDDMTPLCFASHNRGGYEVIVSIIKLLVGRGADVNFLNVYGYSPLLAAIHNHSLGGVEHLLRSGANPNLCKDIRYPPLHTSIKWLDVEITECLIDYGADASSHQISDRFSLLHVAMENENFFGQIFNFDIASKLVTLLMERGVTIGEHDYIDLTLDKIELLEKCERELQTLKETKIHSDYPTTYYEFLLKRDKELIRFLRDENIAATIKSEEYKEEFFYFAHRLKANYDRGLKQIDMINDLRSILSEVFEEVFPEELIFLISDYLNIEDLRKCFGNQSSDWFYNVYTYNVLNQQ